MTGAEGHFDQVHLLECNLDDMTGEELGFVLERVLEEGALDAWFTPVYMKKNRPATQLSVLCKPGDGSRLRELLLAETSTLGVRWQPMRRQIAERRIEQVHTAWGPVRCKLKILRGVVVSVKPEYDDCARLARRCHVALREIIEAAQRAGSHTVDEEEPARG